MHTVKSSSPSRYNKRDDYRSAKTVIADTVDKWMFSWMLDSCHRPGVYYPGRIGEAIRRLPEDDRKLLEKLTSEDFKGDRPLDFSPSPSKSNTRVFRLPHEKTINT